MILNGIKPMKICTHIPGEHGEQGEYGKHKKDNLNTPFMTQNTSAVNQMTRNTLFHGNYGDAWRT